MHTVKSFEKVTSLFHTVGHPAVGDVRCCGETSDDLGMRVGSNLILVNNHDNKNNKFELRLEQPSPADGCEVAIRSRAVEQCSSCTARM